MGKTKKEILTDPLLKKGHLHKEKDKSPRVCPRCRGIGEVESETSLWTVTCGRCDGLGEVYE